MFETISHFRRFLPIRLVHGQAFYHPHRKLLVAFSKEISQIFKAALEKQFHNEPGLSLGNQPRSCLFYQADALTFGFDLSKNLRMLCLGLPDQSFGASARCSCNCGNE